jgi:hypothetical protein
VREQLGQPQHEQQHDEEEEEQGQDGCVPTDGLLDWNVFSFKRHGSEATIQISVQDESMIDSGEVGMSGVGSREPVRELGGGWTGGTVWIASQILARLLVSQPSGFMAEHPRVIELGCGVGLVGMVAAALGATDVALTDMETSIATHNLERCDLDADTRRRLCVSRLEWGCDADLAAVGARPYDLVLGSDIVSGGLSFYCPTDG